MLRRAQTAEELMNLLHLAWYVVRSVGVSSWYNPDSDTCWVAVPLYYWKAKRTTELFWRAECVQVIYNDVARVAVWNLHASLRFARLRVTVCDGNPVGTLLATR
jgi:hypothetical protein